MILLKLAAGLFFLQVRRHRIRIKMACRGDILAAAGHRKEARVAYTAALTAIERLPNRRRSARAVATLENRLRLLVEAISHSD